MDASTPTAANASGYSFSLSRSTVPFLGSPFASLGERLSVARRVRNCTGFAPQGVQNLTCERGSLRRLVRSGSVRFLKTSEAAALLNVSPNTLRAWERRFGYPKPQRSPGRHRLYTHGEVAALRDALQEGLSISSAVSRAREGLAADTNSLVGALISYERERADSAIEAALALRSVERSVEEVLLPTLDEIARRHTLESAAWAFAAHWGADWLLSLI